MDSGKRGIVEKDNPNKKVKQIILRLSKDSNYEIKMASIESVLEEANNKGLDKEKVEAILHQLEEALEIYQPKLGFVKLTPSAENRLYG